MLNNEYLKILKDPKFSDLNVNFLEFWVLEYFEILIVKHLSFKITRAISFPLFGDVPLLGIDRSIMAVLLILFEHSATCYVLTNTHGTSGLLITADSRLIDHHLLTLLHLLEALQAGATSVRIIIHWRAL